MNFFIKNAFVAFAFLALLPGSVAAQVRVFAQIDKSASIYVGEKFGYHIIIDGENKPGQVDLAPLAGYNPQSAGNRDVSQTSISIINGETTRKIVKQYVMSYSLTASQAGRINLPPVTVAIEGKNYQTNPVEVNILQPGTTDQLDLEVTLSEEKCYVGQPVIMTIKFYISTDIGDFQFNIPAFNSDTFYLEEPDISNPQAKEYDLGNGTTVLVSQYRTTHNGRDSILLSFSKVLIPRHSGEIKILPSSVSADVVVGRARSRDPFADNSFFGGFFGTQKQYKRFMVSSQPLKLAVLPLPEQGKPSEFYGLVGRYTITASATPTKVNVGDPITLTIKVGGSKYLKPVQWPNLEQVPELAANFKMPSQKATPTIDNGFKVFTQTIRPDNNQANVIPSMPLVYFDPDTGNYNVAKTKPIKLDLKPSKRLTAADIEGKDFSPINKEVEAIKRGLSANYEGPEVLENMSFSPTNALVSPAYASIWAVPLGILILSLLVKFLTHTSPEKVAAKRRRQASSKAITQLKKFASMDSSQRNEQVALVMKQYIGDRFGKMAGSLTGNDCYEIIINATEDAEIANKYRQTIEHCESARYASINVDIDSGKTKDMIQLIRNIEKKLKR